MLGRYADQFFAKQASERIIAGRPNSDARSIQFPDREAAGTGRVAHVRGHYEMPGPQRAVDANNMLPSMGADTADFAPGAQPVPSNQSNMLPSMGDVMLPSMGALELGKMAPWLIGLGLVGGYILLKRGKRRA